MRQLPPVIYEWLLTIAQFAAAQLQLSSLSLHSVEVPTRVSDLLGVPVWGQVGVCSMGGHLSLLQLPHFEVIMGLADLLA